MNTTSTKPLLPTDAFLGLENIHYLATGLAAPPLKLHQTNIQSYLADRSKGIPAKKAYDAIANVCRTQLASITGADPNQIAFLNNVTQIINLLSAAIDFEYGDNVVVEDIEYPSTSLPWFQNLGQGVEIRVVPTSRLGSGMGSLEKFIDQNTKVVCLSHVSFLTGYKYDLEELSFRLHKYNVRLIVDVSQSLGVVPLSIEHADILVSTAHKWLLGPHGLGILVWNKERWPQLELNTVGWHSIEKSYSYPINGNFKLRQTARKFEGGCLPYPNLYMLNGSLDTILSAKIGNIATYTDQLGSYLIHELGKLGVNVITPLESQNRSGNICLDVENDIFIQSELEKKGIHVVGGHKRIRVSLSLFTTYQDIEVLLKELRRMKL